MEDDPKTNTWPVRALVVTATALALLALAAPQAFGAPRVSNPTADPWPTPPFAAWIKNDYGFVRARPTHASKLLALLRLGDTVTVTGCAPSCDAARAWALVEPRGAVPMGQLRAGEPEETARHTGSQATYFYGRTPRGATPVFAKPDAKSKVIRKEKAEFRLAFVPNPYLGEQGWLQRPDGGYMRKADIKLFTPSTFAGQKDPEAPIAFVRRKVALRPTGEKRPPKDPAAVQWFARYDRMPMQAVRGDKVQVSGGWLPKGLVRIVSPVQRPKGVAQTDKWMHVDLGQQVLAAYKGDQMVFATLVSTGKSGRASTRTKTGTFELYGKTIHSSMRGKPWDDYYAEEVPFVMHYDGGRALHGAYWHDQFGIEKSHGCINLSPADAAWLFAWTTPELPKGWHNVLPNNWDGPIVTVVVDSPRKRETTPLKLADAGARSVADAAAVPRSHR